MHPTYRAAYNAAFTAELHERQKAMLLERIGASPAFPLAETPVFLTPELSDSLATTAREIVAQLGDPARTERMRKAIPARWNAPGMDLFPSLLQVDLAVVREGERLVPKLIELQGFPSLSAFEVFQAAVWSECLQGIPGLPEGPWSPYFSGLDRERFVDLFRRVVLGRRKPEHVVLMDLAPEKQKTWVDFEATRKLLGVESVCPTALEKEGRRLFRRKGGRRIPVERIYNRVVFDELIQSGTALPFDFRDDLDVEWVPHPNWYWTYSKYSLPMLDHPAVPRATFLSELREIPDDLTERFVLKPLFSFAGGGVNVEPTRSDLEAIPDGERDRWCLQEKIAYDPCLVAGDGGGVKVEIRMMFYRPHDGAGPEDAVLGLNLCRLSRGKMLGVDFNKGFTWVGSSVALSPSRP
jgi:hypothetical protein